MKPARPGFSHWMKNDTFAQMSSEITTKDKASAQYWSDVWLHAGLNPPIDVSKGSAKNYPLRKVHEILKKELKGIETKNRTLLEVGCGNSSWLPYFAKEFGMKISGIDYSEVGCDQTKKIFERDKVEGTVYLGDFFNPPSDIPHDFDFVYSGGVVEHFEDTVAAVRAFSTYLKKGGVMITTLPNMTGLQAWFQKTFNKPVYDIHVPLTREKIAEAHRQAGLEILYADYFASTSLYINLEPIDSTPVPMLEIKKLLSKSLSVLSLGLWKIETATFDLPTSRMFSPGIAVLAKKV